MDVDRQITQRPNLPGAGMEPASTPPQSAGTRSSTWQIVLAGIAGLAVAAFIGVVAWGTSPAPGPTSRVSASDYGPAPTYTLTDQNGRTFNSTTVLGKVQVVSYLFPYCTSFCPLLLGSLAQAQRELDRSGLQGRVAFVAFNVDPEHAGPDVMSAFLRQERVDPSRPGVALPDRHAGRRLARHPRTASTSSIKRSRSLTRKRPKRRRRRPARSPRN